MPKAAPHGHNVPPKVIVKKVYIEGHGGHHGGAWKVAYADFVTAMMAFFLLLWLLGATDETKRKGIADYFAPTLIDTRSKGISGSGLLGGESILSNNKTGPKAAAATMASVGVPPPVQATGPDSGIGKKGLERTAAALRAADAKSFEATRRKLMAQIAGSAELSKLSQHVRFVRTDQGLRIDLVDSADYSMFASGTTALDPRASALIGLIARTIADTPNTIMIRGHTDSVPWGDPRAMNNWTLATGRAEATRRRLLVGGIPEARFERIEGVADREPMIASAPMDPRNRRVAITLLYQRGVFGR